MAGVLESRGRGANAPGGWRRLTVRATARRAIPAVAAAMVVAACGNRLPHSQIVSAAVGTRTITVGNGAASNAVTPGGAPGVAGTGSVSAGALSAGGSASPSGGQANPASQVASGSGPPAATSTAAGSTIVVGNVGTYSGIIGALFASGQQMAYVWAKWVNAHGGLNGHPVEVITEDDRGDPGQYLADVKDLVENHHVLAFMGNLVPLTASGAVQYLEQKQIPVVGGDSTSNIWFNSSVMFPDATYFPAFSRAAARQAVTGGKPKVSVIYCAEVEACHTWNDSLQGGAAQKEGATITYTAQVSLAQPDFTSECLQSQNHGAQAVLAAVDANSLVRLSRDCAQQGYHPLYIAVSLAVINSVATDPDLQGLIAPQGTFPWPADDTPAAQQYQQAIATYAPGLQGAGASSSVWASGVLFEKAAAHLPASPTSHDVLEGLWAIRNDTLGGLAPPITYGQAQPPGQSSCYFTVEVQGGKWIAPHGSTMQCLTS